MGEYGIANNIRTGCVQYVCSGIWESSNNIRGIVCDQTGWEMGHFAGIEMSILVELKLKKYFCSTDSHTVSRGLSRSTSKNLSAG